MPDEQQRNKENISANIDMQTTLRHIFFTRTLFFCSQLLLIIYTHIHVHTCWRKYNPSCYTYSHGITFDYSLNCIYILFISVWHPLAQVLIGQSENK